LLLAASLLTLPSERRWLTITVTGKRFPLTKLTMACRRSVGRSLRKAVELSGLTKSVLKPSWATESASTLATLPATGAVFTRKPTSMPPTSWPSMR
jgi:hypothetical protein